MDVPAPLPPAPQPPTRRKFLRRVKQISLGLVAVSGATVGYGFYEASQIRIRRQTVAVRNLPRRFEGTTVGILTDLHHGPFVSLDFVRRAVTVANGLAPDLFALLGDFAHKGTHTHEQLPPCMAALTKLSAPLGVFAVPGNHDMGKNGAIYREVMAATPQVIDLRNRAVPVTRDGETLWLAGVDDLWWGKPDLDAAMKPVPAGAAVVLLSHNPDFAEENPDPRVGLVLSGHTHGGQVLVPGATNPFIPSAYGDKYAQGLVEGPTAPVYVSRGLGLSGLPVRYNCPPELTLLTLRPIT